jgi:hypothetical protein
MAGELRAAASALNERKRALLHMDEFDASVHDTDSQGVSMLLVGFELDPYELEAAQDMGAHLGMRIIRNAPGDLPAALAAMFVDGLAMGLLIAERRAKAGVSA